MGDCPGTPSHLRSGQCSVVQGAVCARQPLLCRQTDTALLKSSTKKKTGFKGMFNKVFGGGSKKDKEKACLWVPAMICCVPCLSVPRPKICCTFVLQPLTSHLRTTSPCPPRADYPLTMPLLSRWVGERVGGWVGPIVGSFCPATPPPPRPPPNGVGSAFSGSWVVKDWEVAGDGIEVLAVVLAEDATCSAFLVCLQDTSCAVSSLFSCTVTTPVCSCGGTNQP